MMSPRTGRAPFTCALPLNARCGITSRCRGVAEGAAGHPANTPDQGGCDGDSERPPHPRHARRPLAVRSPLPRRQPPRRPRARHAIAPGQSGSRGGGRCSGGQAADDDPITAARSLHRLNHRQNPPLHRVRQVGPGVYHRPHILTRHHATAGVFAGGPFAHIASADFAATWTSIRWTVDPKVAGSSPVTLACPKPRGPRRGVFVCGSHECVNRRRGVGGMIGGDIHHRERL